MAKLTKKIIKDISTDMDKAVTDIEEKYGVKIKANGARFTSDYATLKFKVNAIVDGETVTKESLDLKRRASRLGFKEGDELNDGTIVVGYRSRARKNKILLENRITGKKYIAPISYVEDHLVINS